MEVSMDTSPNLTLPPSQPQPQPQPSQIPPSPSNESRKRSLEDVDSKPSASGENQENNDPTLAKQANVTEEKKSGDQESGQNASPTASAGAGDPLVAITNPNPNGNGTTATSTGLSVGAGASPAAKKRKVSPATREAKQQEKEAKEKEREAKERQKVEEKARKEEEKRKKDEEKRVKEEEKKKRDAEREEEKKRKEEKKKAKEEEKAAKEAAKEEKRKKEEEKSKKERAQTKLGSFFAKPKIPAQQPTASSPSKASDANESTRPAVSDYQRAFPDFFLQSHTTVAPPHRFERDSDALHHVQERVDGLMKTGKDQEVPTFRPSEFFRIMPYKRRYGRQAASIKEILLKLQNSGDAALDGNAQTTRPQDLLKGFRMKSLRFGEDVRPPYQGTYSRNVPLSCASKVSRNPFRRELPDTNYDYDSEAEWEEPEEGEDLDSEDEEESEDGEDDMDGFLDDEDDQLEGKRRLIVGDLEPVCSGLRWQESGVDPDLQMYKIETISETVSLPIDPFSTAYWQKPKESAKNSLQGLMNPPASGAEGGLALLGKSRRAFPPEQLAEFKEVVNGSDLTKTGLIEILKKRFPKVSKEVLKDTLNGVATRVGQKEVEKKWVCQ